MGWLIAFAVVVLLACIPAHLRGEYDMRGPRVWLQVGPWQYDLYPKQKATTKRRKTTSTPKSKHVSDASGNKRTSSKNSVDDFVSIVSVILDFVKDLRRKIRVELFEMKIVIGDADPADLAIKYGHACGLIGGFLPQLDQVFVIKKQNIDVSCDFNATSTVITSKLHLSVATGRLVGLLINHGMKYVQNNFKTKNKRKGGAKA